MSAAVTLQNVLSRYSPQRLRKLIPYIPEADKAELGELIEESLCSEDALYWGQNWTLTENPHWKDQGLPFTAPFPKKSYFVPLFEEFKRSKAIFIPKTREMLTSWCAMLWATHQAQWQQAEVIIQTDSEAKAQKLLSYSECLYRNQAGFLKRLHPLKSESALYRQWASGGSVHGIPSGIHKVRMFHPTIYIMDEAAFLPEAEQCFNAAQPVAKQIIAISSAGPGWFGDQCSL